MSHLGAATKKVLTWLLGGIAVLTFGARIYTQFYYLSMPRSPQPLSGRIYPAGAAYNTLVYVKLSEFEWANFLNTPAMSIGVACGLIVCLMHIDRVKRARP